MSSKRNILVLLFIFFLLIPQSVYAAKLPDEQIVNDDNSQIDIRNVDFRSYSGTGTLKVIYQHSAYDDNRANGKSDDDLYEYRFTSKITDEQTGETTVLNEDVEPQIEKPGSKILNVYPDSCKTIIADVIMSDKKYYCDPDTGDQVLTMDKISWSHFFADVTGNLLNADGSYKYDGIYFGSCDGNGSENIPESAVDILKKYIESGYSVVCGHDEQSSNFFKTYFGSVSNETVLIPNDISAGWASKKYQIKVGITDDNGSGTFPTEISSSGNSLTTFPFKFNTGSLIDVNFTHCGYENIRCTDDVMYTLFPTDMVDVWASIGDKDTASSVMTTEIDGKQYYYNPYLFTSKKYPNVACSMIGHSNKGTEAEYKLIVNMLLNISPYYNAPDQQYTKKYRDTAAPDAPVLSLLGVDDNSYVISSEDKGIDISVKMQQSGKYGIDNASGSAEIDDLNVCAGIDRYLYSTDNSAHGGVAYTLDSDNMPTASGDTKEVMSYDTGTSFSIGKTSDKFIHAIAVDRNGNVSSVTTIKNQKYVIITFKNQDETVIDTKLLKWGTPIYVLDCDGYKLREFEAKLSRTLIMDSLSAKKGYTAQGYKVYEDEGAVILKQQYSRDSFTFSNKTKDIDENVEETNENSSKPYIKVIIFGVFCIFVIIVAFICLKKIYKIDR